MHYHNGYLTNDYSERTLICPECKRLIGFTDGKTQSYSICIVCSCGQLIKKDKNKVPHNVSSLKKAYLSDNDYFCPNCGRLLFKINQRHIRNLSFIAVCKCGEAFCGAKHINARERILSPHAILMPDKKEE